MKFIYSLFDRRFSSIICIAIAVLNRIINVMFVSFAGKDKMILVLQSKSLLQGHGISRPFYYFADLDNPVWNFTPRWPPGYPVILAPFLKIFNYDIYWATTTFDIIVCIAFIFIVRKISWQIGFSKTAVNIVTLITGAFEYTFINESLPTDTVSLVLLLAGIMFSLNLLNKPLTATRILLAGFFLFSPCLFRYNYPPATISVPLLMLLFAFIKKDSVLRKKAISLLTVTALFISILFLSIKLSTGESSFILETERGIFPENIVHWFPFIPASFINIAFLTSQLIHKAGIPFGRSFAFLEIINIILFLFFIGLFVYLFKKKFFSTLNIFKWFLFMGLLISITVLVPLAYLSFTYRIQESFYGGWNYVAEGRYFAFLNIYIQLAFIGWVTLYNNTIKNLLFKILAAIGILFLFIDVSHNLYFHSKVAVHYKEYKSAVFREQDYNFFDNLVPELEREYSDHDILVAAPDDNYYYHAASYLGFKGIEDATPLKHGQPVVKRPSILIVMFFDNELEDYKKCIEGNNVVYLKKVYRSNFYLITLNP